MKTNETKNMNNFFEKGDVIIYVLIFVALIVSFLPILSKNEKGITRVVVNDLGFGETIFSYDVLSGDCLFDKEVVSVEDMGEFLTVTINRDDKVNVLIVEKSGYAYMKEANCSFNADCVHSDKITRSGDVIICLPHKIEVVGIGQEEGEIIIG